MKQKQKGNYLSVKNITDSSADIYFYGDIVGSEWDKWEDVDTCPTDVLNILEQAKNAKSLNIYINSGGGSVFAGLAIYNMLKRHQAFKTVYIDSMAASITSVIALAGDRVVIPSNAFIMIHKPLNVVRGNANDFRKMADDLDRIEQGILNVYADNLREGVTIEEIQDMVNAETWLVGPEAVKYFNVELVEANEAVACIGDSFKNFINVPKELSLPQIAAVNETTNEIENMKLQMELLSL